MKNKKLKGLIMLLALSTNSFGQLPTSYVTKVSYHEKKEVAYSLPTEANLNCLTLSELSRYHGYMQFYTMDEFVDEEGDLLTDQKFIEEMHVRDEWMEGYGRITVGKNSVDVYGMESGLLLQKPRTIDSNEVFLSPLQALDYGFLNLNQGYYNQLATDLEALGLAVTQNNDLITASNSQFAITYDHTSKVASATEYDSTGIKVRESVIEYGLSNAGDTYFPETETIVEWFLGKNGCCIRKITSFKRYGYERENNQNEISDRKDNSTTLVNSSIKNSDIQIMSEENGNGFRIGSEIHHNTELGIVVYDMAGKVVLDTKVKEGDVVKLPQDYRAGMFLVHVLIDGSSVPVVGKIIKSNAGSQF